MKNEEKIINIMSFDLKKGTNKIDKPNYLYGFKMCIWVNWNNKQKIIKTW